MSVACASGAKVPGCASAEGRRQVAANGGAAACANTHQQRSADVRRVAKACQARRRMSPLGVAFKD